MERRDVFTLRVFYVRGMDDSALIHLNVINTTTATPPTTTPTTTSTTTTTTTITLPPSPPPPTTNTNNHILHRLKTDINKLCDPFIKLHSFLSQKCS